MPLPPTFEAKLVHAKMLSPSVRELTFARADDAPLAFEAGQWVSLVLPHLSKDSAKGEVRRSYSIASAPDGSPRFEIAVTRVEGGAGSAYLHALEPGASLTAIGPQGFFTRGKAIASPALFVATGTGVTPLRSMIHAAVAQGSRAPTWLLFGVRTREDLLYEEELTRLAAAHPHLRLIATLSRGDEAWSGRRGYVQHHVRELWTELAATSDGPPHAFICGLQRMVGSVRELLRGEMQVPREQVHSERYD